MWDAVETISGIIAFCISVNTSGGNTSLIYVKLCVIHRQWMSGEYTRFHQDDIFCGDTAEEGASLCETKRSSVKPPHQRIAVLCAAESFNTELGFFFFLLPFYVSVHMTQLLHVQVLKFQAFRKSHTALKSSLLLQSGETSHSVLEQRKWM